MSNQTDSHLFTAHSTHVIFPHASAAPGMIVPQIAELFECI